MHHISEIYIKNFKSIVSASFPLSPFTPLVGYNNAGKSNILHALNWMINKSKLPASDFYDQGSSIEVEVKVCGITPEVLDALGDTHRKRMEPLIRDGVIGIKRIQAKPGDESAIKFAVTSETGGLEWINPPTGIEQAMAALFPDSIFIGAMENATEDTTKNATSTTLEKIMKQIIQPIIERHTPAVAKALEDVRSRLSANAENKDETMSQLDTKIHSEISTLFPGLLAKSHIPVPDFSDFLKGATIKVFEDGFESGEGRDASSFGHGAQRSIQISSLKCLASMRRETGEKSIGRTVLLLIDEPELYLHPQAVEIVRSALRALSADGYQVIFTTHSAGMIAREDAGNTLLIRRAPDSGTFCLPRIGDPVSTALKDSPKQAEVLFTITNASKILFSERVIIGEGRTENRVLPDLFQAEFGMRPEECRAGLIFIDGVGNLVGTMSVLNSMGIPCGGIADLDFAFRDAVAKGFIEEDHPSIVGCRRILGRLADAGEIFLGDDGLPRKHSSVSAPAAFKRLAQEVDAKPLIKGLHDHLLKRNVWLWQNGAIEDHLGLPNKGIGSHFALLERMKQKDFFSTIPDEAGVKAMLSWIKSI